MKQTNDKKWCVYIHTNKINNKVYIGITCRKPKDRWGKNGYNYTQKEQPVMYNAIKKYGWNNFEHIIFANDLTFQDACMMEVGLIALYKANVHRWGSKAEGYNETDGGEGSNGYKLTEEHKKYISKIQSIPVVQLDLEGNFISEYSSMSEAAKKIGCHVSCIGDCCNKKISTSHGYIWVLKEKYENGEYTIVQNNKKQNVLNSKNEIIMSGRIVKQYSISGNFIAEYVSIMDASRQCKINNKCISDCCAGIQKTAGGFVWMYSDDDKYIDFNDIKVPTKYNLTIGNITLSGRQWAHKLSIQESTIYNYIRQYGDELTIKLIEEMLKDLPKNKKRRGGQSWFDVYGIETSK